MAIIMEEEKLRDFIRTEQEKYRKSGGAYKRRRVPLGFFAPKGEDANMSIEEIAGVLAKRAMLVRKIYEEEADEGSEL